MAFDFTKGDSVSAPTSPGSSGFKFQNGQVVTPQTSQPASPSIPGAGTFEKGPSYGSQVGDAFKTAQDKTQASASKFWSDSGVVDKGEDLLGAFSGAASELTSPLAPLFKPVSDTINTVGKAVGSIPAVQDFAASKAGQVTSRVAGDVADVANVAGTVLGAKGGVEGAPGALETLQKGGQAADATINAGLDTVRSGLKSSDADVVSSYMKAVKPSTAGKTGPGQLDKYNANVTSAVKSILQNKDKLSFETDSGTEAGRTPQTRGELANAVAQTKSEIFNKYDALTKQATGQGVKVPLDKAGGALDDVINSEALKLTNPEAINYAKGIQSRLKNEDGSYKAITPDVAQSAITNWNSSLKAFYQNPSYETASRAAIDAGVVNEVRGALDDHINSATGENYQGLKNQYGALSAIEKDVNKSAVMQAKQVGTPASGLGKYVDVFSGGDMVSGLLSLNPALFAKGAAQAGISHFFQWFNNPDRAVSTMFKSAAGNTIGDKVAGSIGEPSIGLSTKSVVPDPMKIAPNMDAEDIKIVRNYLDLQDGKVKSGGNADFSASTKMDDLLQNMGVKSNIFPTEKAKAEWVANLREAYESGKNEGDAKPTSVPKKK